MPLDIKAGRTLYEIVLEIKGGGESLQAMAGQATRAEAEMLNLAGAITKVKRESKDLADQRAKETIKPSPDVDVIKDYDKQIAVKGKTEKILQRQFDDLQRGSKAVRTQITAVRRAHKEIRKEMRKTFDLADKLMQRAEATPLTGLSAKLRTEAATLRRRAYYEPPKASREKLGVIEAKGERLVMSQAAGKQLARNADLIEKLGHELDITKKKHRTFYQQMEEGTESSRQFNRVNVAQNNTLDKMDNKLDEVTRGVAEGTMSQTRATAILEGMSNSTREYNHAMEREIVLVQKTAKEEAQRTAQRARDYKKEAGWMKRRATMVRNLHAKIKKMEEIQRRTGTTMEDAGVSVNLMDFKGELNELQNASKRTFELMGRDLENELDTALKKVSVLDKRFAAEKKVRERRIADIRQTAANAQYLTEMQLSKKLHHFRRMWEKKEIDITQAEYKQLYNKIETMAKKAKKHGGPVAGPSRQTDVFLGVVKGAVIGRMARVMFDVISRLGFAFTSVFRTGIMFNKELEETRIGLAAVIGQSYEYATSQGRILKGQEAYNAALGEAKDMQASMLSVANRSVVTFEQLNNVMMQGSALLSSRGVDLDEQVELIALIVTAEKAIGIQQQQQFMEMRQLLEGDLRRGQLARQLVASGAIALEDLRNLTGPALVKALRDALREFEYAGIKHLSTIQGKFEQLTDTMKFQLANVFSDPDVQNSIGLIMDNLYKKFFVTVRVGNKEVTTLTSRSRELLKIFTELTKIVANLLDMFFKWINPKTVMKVAATIAVLLTLTGAFLGLKVVMSAVTVAMQAFGLASAATIPVLGQLGVAIAAIGFAYTAVSTGLDNISDRMYDVSKSAALVDGKLRPLNKTTLEYTKTLVEKGKRLRSLVDQYEKLKIKYEASGKTSKKLRKEMNLLAEEIRKLHKYGVYETKDGLDVYIGQVSQIATGWQEASRSLTDYILLQMEQLNVAVEVYRKERDELRNIEVVRERARKKMDLEAAKAPRVGKRGLQEKVRAYLHEAGIPLEDVTDELIRGVIEYWAKTAYTLDVKGVAVYPSGMHLGAQITTALGYGMESPLLSTELHDLLRDVIKRTEDYTSPENLQLIVGEPGVRWFRKYIDMHEELKTLTQDIGTAARAYVAALDVDKNIADLAEAEENLRKAEAGARHYVVFKEMMIKRDLWRVVEDPKRGAKGKEKETMEDYLEDKLDAVKLAKSELEQHQLLIQVLKQMGKYRKQYLDHEYAMSKKLFPYELERAKLLKEQLFYEKQTQDLWKSGGGDTAVLENVERKLAEVEKKIVTVNEQITNIKTKTEATTKEHLDSLNSNFKKHMLAIHGIIKEKSPALAEAIKKLYDSGVVIPLKDVMKQLTTTMAAAAKAKLDVLQKELDVVNAKLAKAQKEYTKVESRGQTVGSNKQELERRTVAMKTLAAKVLELEEKMTQARIGGEWATFAEWQKIAEKKFKLEQTRRDEQEARIKKIHAMEDKSEDDRKKAIKEILDEEEANFTAKQKMRGAEIEMLDLEASMLQRAYEKGEIGPREFEAELEKIKDKSHWLLVEGAEEYVEAIRHFHTLIQWVENLGYGDQVEGITIFLASIMGMYSQTADKLDETTYTAERLADTFDRLVSGITAAFSAFNSALPKSVGLFLSNIKLLQSSLKSLSDDGIKFGGGVEKLFGVSGAWKGMTSGGAKNFLRGAAGLAQTAGAIIGIVSSLVGAFTGIFKRAAKKIAKEIEKNFAEIMDAYQSGSTTLVATIQALENERASAIRRLSGKKGGKDELNRILPEIDRQLDELRNEQTRIFEDMEDALKMLRLDEAVRGIQKSFTSIIDQFEEYIDAGGDVATANEFLELSFAELRENLEGQLDDLTEAFLESLQEANEQWLEGAEDVWGRLISIEERAKQDLLELDKDYMEKKADLIKSMADAEEDYAEYVKAKEEEIQAIRDEGIATRRKSTEQDKLDRISELQNEMQIEHSAHQERLAELQEQLKLEDELYAQAVSRIDLRLERERAEHEERMANIQEEYEEERDNFLMQIEYLERLIALRLETVELIHTELDITRILLGKWKEWWERMEDYDGPQPMVGSEGGGTGNVYNNNTYNVEVTGSGLSEQELQNAIINALNTVAGTI